MKACQNDFKEFGLYGSISLWYFIFKFLYIISIQNEQQGGKEPNYSVFIKRSIKYYPLQLVILKILK